MGHINQMMAEIKQHRTPLLVQMDKLGKTIFAIILAMMAALFVFSIMLRDIPMSELLLSLITLTIAGAMFFIVEIEKRLTRWFRKAT